MASDPNPLPRLAAAPPMRSQLAIPNLRPFQNHVVHCRLQANTREVAGRRKDGVLPLSEARAVGIARTFSLLQETRATDRPSQQLCNPARMRRGSL